MAPATAGLEGIQQVTNWLGEPILKYLQQVNPPKQDPTKRGMFGEEAELAKAAQAGTYIPSPEQQEILGRVPAAPGAPSPEITPSVSTAKAAADRLDIPGAEARGPSVALEPIESRAGKIRRELDTTRGKLQALLAVGETSAAEWKTKLADAQEFLANAKMVDPWSTKSFGKRLMMGLAMGLGAFGQALAGGENVAMKIIQDQINGEIEAQKAELGKKANLYSVMLQQFGDETRATAATADTLWRLAGTFNDELAGLAKGITEDKTGELYVPGALSQDGGPGLAPTKEDAQKIRGTMAVLGDFQRAVADAKKFRAEKGISPIGEERTRGNSMATDLKLKVKDLAALGVLSASDLELLQSMVPGSLSEIGNVAAKLDELQKIVERKEETYLRAYGLMPPPKYAPGGMTQRPSEFGGVR